MEKKEADVVTAALSLPATSRLMIIKKLTDSLLDDAMVGEEAARLERDWFCEAESRVSAFERGEIEALPGDQVIRDLRARTAG